ncbi:MAG: 50S ribosomal protein L30 [Firmicutes bacterium]|nr:50S ribosomal protein L30 [Bacillota bacterium]
MAKVKITLIRSPIGCPPNQRATVKALGLNRLHQSVVHDQTAAIRGMINKVQHLIECEQL